MEPSIKDQKIQAMKNYNKRATFVYNLVLYALTSIITCFFFSYSFWFPSLDHFISSLPNSVSFFLSAKCFFVVGNLIVLVLVGESKLKQSSSTPDIYDEYMSRSRSNHQNHVESKEKHGFMKSMIVEEVRVCKPSNMLHEEKKKGMRKSKSEVWGESGIIRSKGKKEEAHKCSSDGKKIGMRSSKSEVWGESGIIKIKMKKKESGSEEKKIGMKSSKSEIWNVSENVMREKNKGKREEEIHKSGVNHEEKIIGMSSSKSEIWGDSEIMISKGVKEGSFKSSDVCNDEGKIIEMKGSKSEVWGECDIIKSEGVKEEEEESSKSSNISKYEEKSRGMRSCKSAIWGESGIIKSKGKKEEFCKNSNMGYIEEKKMGMRSCKSAIWGESDIVKEIRAKKVEQTYMAEEDLNKRVEAFIARVNNQRLMEAELVDQVTAA